MEIAAAWEAMRAHLQQVLEDSSSLGKNSSRFKLNSAS
jgi:hypothetical protein